VEPRKERITKTKTKTTTTTTATVTTTATSNYKIYILEQCKVVLVLFLLTEHHAMKAYWGSEGIVPLIF
jgi:hypothetical protein